MVVWEILDPEIGKWGPRSLRLVKFVYPKSV